VTCEVFDQIGRLPIMADKRRQLHPSVRVGWHMYERVVSETYDVVPRRACASAAVIKSNGTHQTRRTRIPLVLVCVPIRQRSFHRFVAPGTKLLLKSTEFARPRAV
jgi:hypothetical protein